MIVPALLLTVSIIGTVIATSQPVWGDLVLLAGPCAIASAILLLREARVWLAGQSRRSARGAVVIDGSNVMYWWGGTPLITPVQDVVRTLKDLGFKTGVVFDANAGHLLTNAYKDDAALAAMLKLPVDQVMVVPSGSPADPFILTAAREMGAVVVSNDRYRDWADDFPEVLRRGHLIKAGYRQQELWFDFATLSDEQSAA